MTFKSYCKWTDDQKSIFKSKQLEDFLRIKDLLINYFSNRDDDCWKAIALKMASVRKNCDVIDYQEESTADAYVIQHLLDRYHRFQIMQNCLLENDLSNRKTDRPIRILDVGTGPAPALLAFSDYYQELNTALGEMVYSCKEDYVEQSNGFRAFLHRFCEMALSVPHRYAVKFLFCTNTIIEGVNTSAKNVIYYDKKIGPKDIDYFDYANIRGRAGRLMEHYVGKIVNLHRPPKEEKTYVDFPFYEQNPIASEILVNLDENEIKDINDNRVRYARFKEKDPALQELLIRNGVSIEGQEAILEKLFLDLASPEKRRLIIWSRIDGQLYKRLEYIFGLCWETLSSQEERKSFGAKGWVVNKIVGNCYRTSLNQMIENDILFRAQKLAEEKGAEFISVDDMFRAYPKEMQERTDNIVERIFALQKNWLQYRAPKWINVVDSLQKYATSKLGLQSGDYSYVAEMIENEFVQSSLRILLEYGIPLSAVQKIQLFLQVHKVDTNRISEDKALELIANYREELRKYLSEYEMEIVERAI